MDPALPTAVRTLRQALYKTIVELKQRQPQLVFFTESEALLTPKSGPTDRSIERAVVRLTFRLLISETEMQGALAGARQRTRMGRGKLTTKKGTWYNPGSEGLQEKVDEELGAGPLSKTHMEYGAFNHIGHVPQSCEGDAQLLLASQGIHPGIRPASRQLCLPLHHHPLDDNSVDDNVDNVKAKRVVCTTQTTFSSAFIGESKFDGPARPQFAVTQAAVFKR